MQNSMQINADASFGEKLKAGWKKNGSAILGFLLAVVIAFAIGGIVIAMLGYNPFQVYTELFKGALVGKLNIGTMLEKFTTSLLLGLAFNICAKVQYFNLGLEGCLYFGALAYAVVGYQFPNLPGFIYLPICILAAMITGAIWSFVPAFFKAYYNVNEVCVTMMLNSVAVLMTGYAIRYVWAAKTSIPQTPELVQQVKLTQILKPSRVSTGIFIAIGIYFLMLWVFRRTTFGFRINTVGDNPFFADYVGIKAKKVVMITVMLGGAVAGLAGGLEVGGLYGRLMDQFADGCTFDGVLASRFVNNNINLLPFSALGLAILKTGAYGVERYTGVPRPFIDCLTAMLILLLGMDKLFSFSGLRKKMQNKKKQKTATSAAE